MNLRLKHIPIALYLGVLSVSVADPLLITDIRTESGNIGLRWTGASNLCIVTRSASATSLRTEFVGDVLSAPYTVFPETNRFGFYRIRQVEAVSLPDPLFRAALLDALPRKYAPTTEVYDIDLVGLTELRIPNLGLTSLAGIQWMTDLAILDCYYNNLTSLDLSKNSKLIYLDCDGNSLTNLDLTGSASLTVVDCYNNNLADLALAGCSGLEELFCYNNNLLRLSLPANSSLTSVGCQNNLLETLDLSGCSRLKRLDCYSNSLTNLNLSASTNLTYVDCRDNPILEIVVANTNRLPATLLYSGHPVIRTP